MAYLCPHCSGRVERASNHRAQWAFGLMGALIYAGLFSFECRRCGKIPLRDFSKEIRSEMILGSVAMTVGGLVIAAGAIWLLMVLHA